MTALEVGGELQACDRPTIPVPEPRVSGIRLRVSQISICAASVDVVTCDLSRDPRSESYMPRAGTPRRSGAQRGAVAGCSDALDPHENHASRAFLEPFRGRRA